MTTANKNSAGMNIKVGRARSAAERSFDTEWYGNSFRLSVDGANRMCKAINHYRDACVDAGVIASGFHMIPNLDRSLGEEAAMHQANAVLALHAKAFAGLAA